MLAPISITAAEVAPGGVQINENDLERLNPSDIKDVFNGDSSIHVGGGSDAVRKLYVNGLENTNLNVKIDEARQVDSAFHHLGTANIDPGLLKSVSVETGVGPVDVGPNALGGSISFETKDARDLVEAGNVFGGFSGLQYETNGEAYTETAAVAAQHENVEVLAYGSNEHGSNYKDGDGVEAEATRPNQRDILGKLAWTSNSGARIETNGGYLTDKGIRPSRGNFGALTSGLTPTYQEYRRKNFSFSYRDEAPTAMVNPELVLSFSQAHMFINALQGGPRTFDLNSRTTSYSGKLANTFSTGLGIAESGSVTVGTDFYFDRGDGEFYQLSGPPGTAFGTGSETSKNVGLFIQTRMNIATDLRASLGIRYDQQWFEGIDETRLTGGGPSVSANIEYDFLSPLTGYAGVASTYGGIPLGESAIYNFSGTWDYTGLSSSRSQNYKLGVKGESGPLSGDVHAYYTEILGSHDRGNIIRNRTRDITSQGFNVSGRYDEPEIGYVGASYSYNKFRSDGDLLASGSASFHGLDMGSTAALQFGKTWFDLGLTAGASVEYAFENDSNQVTPLEAYTLANIFLGYEPEPIEGLSIRFDIKNLFDTTYVDRATAGVDNTSVIPYNEPGRSYQISAKFEF